jgi:hypothetical protein
MTTVDGGSEGTSESGSEGASDQGASESQNAESTSNAGTDAEAGVNHEVSAGSAAAEATGRQGQGSVRQEFLREAESQVNIDGVVNGGVAGRDYVVINVSTPSGTKRRRMPLMSKREIALVRGAFVETEGWSDIVRSSARHSVVILRGAAGHGRYTSAVKLLLEFNVENIYRLDSVSDLNQLPDAIPQMPGRPGFVLASESMDQSTLTATAIRNAVEALDAVDGRIVVTAGGGSFGDDDVLDYVVSMHGGADVHRIVERHLEHRLGHRRAEEVLAQTGIQDLLRKMLTVGTPCGRAAIIAEKIAEATDDPIDITVVRTRITEHSNDGFDIWFDGLGDIDTRCFAIALAFLNGVSYDKVAQAARQLRRSVRNSSKLVINKKSIEPTIRDPFRVSRSRRLASLRARIEHTELLQPYGYIPVEAVAYAVKDTADEVIRHAWQSYQIQHTLLRWLGDLVNDDSEHVRILAGFGLGKLALMSFDYLDDKVFTPHTVNERTWSPAWCDAIAYALAVVAADPARRHTVTRVIGRWYGNRRRPYAQATAARVYGGLGRTDPIGAIDALERLVMINDVRVARAIGDSLADLIAKDPQTITPLVLDRMLRWFASHKRHMSGQLIFLILANALIYPADAHSGRSADWPTLLVLLTEEPGLRNSMIPLWRQVITAADFPDLTEQVITAWAGLAENDAMLRVAFVKLLRAVGQSDQRAAAILLRWVAKWRTEDNLAPRPLTAEAVEWELAPGQLAPGQLVSGQLVSGKGTV